jgi:hypothetical protein
MPGAHVPVISFIYRSGLFPFMKAGAAKAVQSEILRVTQMNLTFIFI